MEDIYWDYINPILGGLITFACLIEGTIIYKIRNKMTTSMVYILNLAISDLLIGIMILCIKGVHILMLKMGPKLRENIWLVEIYAVLSFVFLRLSLVTSVLNIIAIAVDRWVAVARPYFYRKLKSKHAVLICVAVWTVAMSVVAMYYTMVRSHIQSATIRMEFELLIFPLLTIPTLIGLFFSYFSILKSLKTSREEFTNQQRDSEVDASITYHAQREYKVLKLSIAIIATFGVCWMPLAMYGIIRAFDINSREAQISTFAISLFNSLLNPIVYFHHKWDTVVKGLRKIRDSVCCCPNNGLPRTRVNTSSPCTIEEEQVMRVFQNFDVENCNSANEQLQSPNIANRKATHSF